MLDAYCGTTQAQLRERLRRAYERVRELERRRDELRELAGARERELDLVRFELDEIEAVDPREDEELELIAERDRLRHLETLRGAAAAGAEAISPESGTGVRELLASRQAGGRAGGGDRSGARGTCAAARRAPLRG